ncbi:MAG TPA: hypothetical protein VK112_06635 [Fodinibius sp.]|nr:hypothetical protein [Fodinibius sp.]
MRKLFLAAIILVMLTGGCSLFESDELTLPHEFRDQSAYHLSDFHLNGQYTYWEVRRNGIPDTTTHETIRSYDNSIYESLSSGQRQKIKAATTQRGFVQLCIPGGCSGYGVALHGDTVELIDSDKKLLTFFGPIDTEAELHLWLWAKFYSAFISYKKETSGYQAIVKEDNYCGEIKKKLILVNQDGAITDLKTISTETYRGCY